MVGVLLVLQLLVTCNVITGEGWRIHFYKDTYIHYIGTHKHTLIHTLYRYPQTQTHTLYRPQTHTYTYII